MTHYIEIMTTNGEHGPMSQSYGVWKVIINSGLLETKPALFPMSNPPAPLGETHMYEEKKTIFIKQVGRFHLSLRRKASMCHHCLVVRKRELTLPVVGTLKDFLTECE